MFGSTATWRNVQRMLPATAGQMTLWTSGFSFIDPTKTRKAMPIRTNVSVRATPRSRWLSARVEVGGSYQIACACCTPVAATVASRKPLACGFLPT